MSAAWQDRRVAESNGQIRQRKLEETAQTSRFRGRTWRDGGSRQRQHHGDQLGKHHGDWWSCDAGPSFWPDLQSRKTCSHQTKEMLLQALAGSGSEPRSGRGGRRFKSCHSDHYFNLLQDRTFRRRNEMLNEMRWFDRVLAGRRKNTSAFRRQVQRRWP